MTRPARQKRDFMEVARCVVEQAIGEQMDGSPLVVPVDLRNPHAVALGQLGGKKGGKTRAQRLSAAKRKEIAKLGAEARWSTQRPVSD
jgi:hypothetical protein